MYAIPAGVTPNGLQTIIRVHCGLNGFSMVSAVHTEGQEPAESLEKLIRQTGIFLGQGLDIPITVEKGEGATVAWMTTVEFNNGRRANAVLTADETTPVEKLNDYPRRLQAMVGISIVRSMELAVGPAHLGDGTLRGMAEAGLLELPLAGEPLPLTGPLWISSLAV